MDRTCRVEAPPDLGKDQEHSKAFWEQATPKNNVIGIGGGRNYTLYARATDHIEVWIAGEPAPKPQGGALVTCALIQTKPTADVHTLEQLQSVHGRSQPTTAHDA